MPRPATPEGTNTVSKYYDETSPITIRLPDAEIGLLRAAQDRAAMLPMDWYREAVLVAAGAKELAKAVRAEAQENPSKGRKGRDRDLRLSRTKSTAGAVTFRLPLEERAVVDEAVAKTGLSINQWCRSVFLIYAGQAEGRLEELRREHEEIVAQLRRVQSAARAA